MGSVQNEAKVAVITGGTVGQLFLFIPLLALLS
jgi:hypothetical protein